MGIIANHHCIVVMNLSWHSNLPLQRPTAQTLNKNCCAWNKNVTFLKKKTKKQVIYLKKSDQNSKKFIMLKRVRFDNLIQLKSFHFTVCTHTYWHIVIETVAEQITRMAAMEDTIRKMQIEIDDNKMIASVSENTKQVSPSERQFYVWYTSLSS